MHTKNNALRRGFGVRFVIIVTGLTLICSSCPRNASETPGTNGSGTKPSASANAPLFEGWESPQAVLVFSGDEHGYMEPCGCSENQTGGFAHRADLIRQIKEDRKWHVTAFDVGGILNTERVTYPQSKIKFEHMLHGMNRMGYQGLELGYEELLLGPDSIYQMQTQLAATENFDVPFLGGNITFYGTQDLGAHINTRIVEVGETKVGVVGIVGSTTQKKVKDTGLANDETLLKMDPPDEFIQSAIEKMQAENVDWLVLLSHSEPAESKSLAEQFPQFQIVVTAGSPEDPRTEPEFVGETMIVEVGKKGKNVAVVGLFAEQELKHELVALDAFRFKSHPDMIQLMREYQQSLEENYTELVNDDLSVSHPSGNHFAGAESCKECHQTPYGIWSKTKHAAAFESLKVGHVDEKHPEPDPNWVSRINDPECLCCHTTGWDTQAALRFDSGFLDAKSTPHLAGQQCENCHGPAAEHIALEKRWSPGSQLTPDLIEARKALQLNIETAKKQTCVKCHDHDNSPKFDFDQYWKEVMHTGKKSG